MLDLRALTYLQASNTVPSLMDSMDRLSVLILGKLVSGEKPTVVSTKNLNVTLVKSTPADICSRPLTTGGEGSVTLPSDWCTIAPPSINCSSTEPVSAKVIQQLLQLYRPTICI